MGEPRDSSSFNSDDASLHPLGVSDLHHRIPFGLDAPIRLSVAAKLAFPNGSMTASGLRREAARGRLTIERIAGKDFTTLDEIKKMRELCRVQVKEPDCSNASHATVDESSSPKLFGSSRKSLGISPQDALRARLTKSSPTAEET